MKESVRRTAIPKALTSITQSNPVQPTRPLTQNSLLCSSSLPPIDCTLTNPGRSPRTCARWGLQSAQTSMPHCLQWCRLRPRRRAKSDGDDGAALIVEEEEDDDDAEEKDIDDEAEGDDDDDEEMVQGTAAPNSASHSMQ